MSTTQAASRSCRGARAAIAHRLAVLRVAGAVDADPGRVLAWYRKTPIAELDWRTADHLVAGGRATEAMAFLRSIASRLRD